MIGIPRRLRSPAIPAAGFLACALLAWRPADAPSPYDYDASRPLDVQSTRVEEVDGIRLEDLSYDGPAGGRVTGTLVAPARAGARPQKPAGILFLHWGQGDRNEFVPEAIAFARRGALGLTIDAPWLRPREWAAPDEGQLDEPEKDARLYVRIIVELRRGVDLLLARGADPARLAYVGHSFGATRGGVLAGVERRIRCYVLIGGLPSIADMARRDAGRPGLPEESRAKAEKYAAAIDPYDPIHFIGRAAPARLLFQFASRDRYISRDDALRYFAAASEPKTIEWYVDGHDFHEPAAWNARAAFLARELRLAPDERPRGKR